MTTNDQHEEAYHWYLHLAGRFPQLTADQEQDLARRVAQGDRQAAEQLILSNLLLVVSIAKRYAPAGPLTLLDLIQEGNCGLIEAARRYRTGRARFTTFATHWVSKYIRQALVKGTWFSGPRAVFFAALRYQQAAGQHPAGPDGSQTPLPEPVERLLTSVVSLEAWLSTSVALEQGTEWHEPEALAAQGTTSSQQQTTSQVAGALAQLSPQERLIVELYYGLGEGVHLPSFREVGQALGLSSERARQFERQAIQKLRSLLAGVVEQEEEGKHA